MMNIDSTIPTISRPFPAPGPVDPRGFRGELRRNAGLAVAAGAGLTVIWALTGGGTFWPLWAWLGLGTAVVADTAFRRAMRSSPGRPRLLAVITAVAAVLVPVELALWVIAGGGYFWPAWSVLLLVAVLVVRAGIGSIPAAAVHR